MNKKYVVLALSLFVSLVMIMFYQYHLFYDGKLHVVFCNVGQGDAIFIRTPSGKDILVDGGPGDAVLACLNGHMPFWDKKIELVILTHPHADHLEGLLEVMERYKVLSFATERLDNKTEGFARLKQILGRNKIVSQYLFFKDKLTISDGVLITILGPTESFLTRTSPNGSIGETGEFASLEILVSHGAFSMLLTGDSQASELEEAIQLSVFGSQLSDYGQPVVGLSDKLKTDKLKSENRQQKTDNRTITVLQLPHHGSKTGITEEILEKLSPQLAVISVGKNKYGHPSGEVIEKLSNKDIKTLRTDKNGEIEIVSDGEKWGVR